MELKQRIYAAFTQTELRDNLYEVQNRVLTFLDQ
jgi:hypothetical protein